MRICDLCRKFSVSSPTIYKVIHRARLNDYSVHKSVNKRFRCVKYGLKRLAKIEEQIEKRLKKEARRYNKKYPGEMCHFDTKRLPLLKGENSIEKREYLFVGIDDFSRELYAAILSDKTQYSAERFLSQVIDECPYTIEQAYSDNGTEYKNLVYGISEKKDGTMKFLNNTGGSAVKLNRKKFFAKRSIKLNQIISAGLVHKNRVKIVGKNDAGKFISGFDGLITNENNLYLTITVADCLPIYIYDFKKKIIGIVHAGWQGVRQNIIKSAVVSMKENFNSNPSDIFIHIGVHLQKCHFEIKNDVLKKFKQHKNAIIKKDGKIFIDLSLIVKIQLLEQKILKKNISISDECVACLKNRYFSYRRDKPKNIKAMIAHIGIIK